MIRPVLAFVALVAAPFIQVAAAADLGLAPAPISVAQDDNSSFFGSGWYIRGDLGYSRPEGPSASFSGVALDRVSIADSPTLGGGVGYKISNWFRVDVTGDYLFSAKVKYSPLGCCLLTDQSRIGGWTALANGYVDLGTWSAVTPYIGAGVGFSDTEVSKTVNPNFGVIGQPSVGQPFTSKMSAGLAWALMAGVAVDVAPSLKIDLGYRFLKVADARSAPDVFGQSTAFKSLGAHQFRIGLRYMFDE